MWYVLVPPEVSTRLVDLAFAVVTGGGGWLLSEVSRRRQSAAEERGRRLRSCLELVIAVGHLQALVAAHRVQWLSPRPRLMAALDALAEMVGAGPDASLRTTAPVAYQVVRRWERAEFDAGRAETFPAMLRVNAAHAEILLLGDAALTAAAQRVVDAAVAAAGALDQPRRVRDRYEAALADATRVFGQDAGLSAAAAATSPSWWRCWWRPRAYR